MIEARQVRELTIDAPRGEAGGHFIAAGSGLVRTGEHLYVIADDERELAVFAPDGDSPGRLARFLPGVLPTDPEKRKRCKPDLEALALLPSPDRGAGVLFGLESGSRPQRRGGVLWQLDERGALDGRPRRVDIAPLYQALEAEIPDLNVEGATVVGERLLLFQRGNGPAGVNAVIELDFGMAWRELEQGRLSARPLRRIRPYELGEVEGVRLCFSDATALRDGSVLFTAVAEAGDDTYLDGACVGAAIGLIGAGGELIAIEVLEPAAKVEGVEAEERSDGLRVLMVADADDPGKPSPLLVAQLDSPPF